MTQDRIYGHKNIINSENAGAEQSYCYHPEGNILQYYMALTLQWLANANNLLIVFFFLTEDTLYFLSVISCGTSADR